MGKEAATGGQDDLASAYADGRMREWEEGLPCDEDLTPLSQTLITSELASAFSITLEPPRTILDAYRASKDTIASLHHGTPSSSYSRAFALGTLPSFAETARSADPEDLLVIEGDESADAVEDVDSPPRADGGGRSERRWILPDAEAAAAGVVVAAPQEIRGRGRLPGLNERRAQGDHASDEPGGAHKGERHQPSAEVPVISEEDAGRFLHFRPSGCFNACATEPARDAICSSANVVCCSSCLIPIPVQGMAHSRLGARVPIVPVNGRHGAVAYQGFEVLHPYPLLEERQEDCTRTLAPYPGVSAGDK